MLRPLTLEISLAQITRPEKSVRSHHLSGLLGAIPITTHDLRAFDANLANVGLTRRQGFVVVIPD
jgi:hypothetical protein